MKERHHIDGKPLRTFGIRGIPTLIVFKGGREHARQSGAMDLSTLQRWLNSVL